MRSRLLVRRRVGWFAAIVISGAWFSTLALADDESDRRGLLSDIDARLSSAYSELSGVRSDSDDGDIRDADNYVEQVRDLVSRLDRVKGDDAKAREVADKYPGYVEKFKRANAALRSMKGYQNANITLMKTCQDKNAELVAQAKDFEDRNDPEGLEKLPRLAADAKNLTVRFLEEAEKFRAQMEDWKRTVQYFDVSDGRWNDLRSVLTSESNDMYSYWKSDQDTAKERCKDLVAGPDHPAVAAVLRKLANSSTGRKEVIENLQKLIYEMATRLKEVPGASGTYAVDNVREKLDSIDASLAILERTKGSDRRAKELADLWPVIAREARPPLEPLKTLKEFHHVFDDLPAKCKDMESKLDAFISNNGDDVDGIDKIPEFAKELGNPVVVGMVKAKDVIEKMKVARDNAQRFSRSDVPWGEVTSAFRTAAVTVYDFIEDRYDDTEAACREIVKLEDHPKVKAAQTRLRGLATVDGEQLERDVAQWVANARAVYTLDCTGMKELWAAYCGEDWEPGSDNAGPKARARAQADVIRNRVMPAIEPLLARLPVLEAKVQILQAKKETRVRGNQLRAELTKQKPRLERLTANENWKGNYNLLTQFANTYGVARHAALWSDFGCNVPLRADAEAEFPVSDEHRKPDCIIASKCEVWEFKADSPGGRSRRGAAGCFVSEDCPTLLHREVQARRASRPASRRK
jgi:hypothetical protein